MAIPTNTDCGLWSYPTFNTTLLKTGTNIKLSKAKKGSIAWNKGLKNVNGLSLAKIVLNLQNGVYYQSCKEAAFAYGYKHSTLKSMLNGTNRNKTSMIYIN